MCYICHIKYIYSLKTFINRRNCCQSAPQRHKSGSTETTENSFTHLLTTKLEHVTCTLYKKNAWAKIHYIKQILVQKTSKWKIIMTYQKQNFKKDIRTIKNLSLVKSTEMTRKYQTNTGKLKLQKKSQS